MISFHNAHIKVTENFIYVKDIWQMHISIIENDSFFLGTLLENIKIGRTERKSKKKIYWNIK